MRRNLSLVLQVACFIGRYSRVDFEFEARDLNVARSE